MMREIYRKRGGEVRCPLRKTSASGRVGYFKTTAALNAVEEKRGRAFPRLMRKGLPKYVGLWAAFQSLGRGRDQALV